MKRTVISDGLVYRANIDGVPQLVILVQRKGRKELVQPLTGPDTSNYVMLRASELVEHSDELDVDSLSAGACAALAIHSASERTRKRALLAMRRHNERAAVDERRSHLRLVRKDESDV